MGRAISGLESSHAFVGPAKTFAKGVGKVGLGRGGVPLSFLELVFLPVLIFVGGGVKNWLFDFRRGLDAQSCAAAGWPPRY